jgi:hypothetical protein
MLFKDLPEGSQFIFKSAVDAGDGDKLEAGIIIYIKLEHPVYSCKDMLTNAISLPGGVPVNIKEDAEILYLLT